MSNAVTESAAQLMQRVKNALLNPEGNLHNLLPSGWKPEKFAAGAMLAIQRNPRLLECNRLTLLGAFYQAAQLGLSMDPTLGQCAIIPRNIRVKDSEGNISETLVAMFQPEYRGMKAVVARHPAVRAVDERLVYSKDEFEIDESDPTRPIHHKPCLAADRGEIIGAYSRTIAHDGTIIHYEWMPIEELEGIRMRDVSKSTAWDTDRGEMYRKTVCKRNCKHSTMEDPDIARLIHLDGQAQAGEYQQLDALVEKDRPALQPATMADKTEENVSAATEAVDDAIHNIDAGEDEDRPGVELAEGEEPLDMSPISAEQDVKFNAMINRVAKLMAKAEGRTAGTCAHSLREEVMSHIGGNMCSGTYEAAMQFLRSREGATGE